MNNFLDKTNAPMQRFFEIVYKLLILNVLFVLFTIIGFVVFGFFPSLLTLYRLVKRTFHDKEESISYFAEYKKGFKDNFKKGNALFFIVLILGSITVLDLVFLWTNYLNVDVLTFTGVLFSIGGLLLGYVVFGVILYVPVIHAYYERFTVKEVFKFSFFTVLSAPINTFLLLGLAGLSYVVFSVLITITPFVGASLPVLGFTCIYSLKYHQIFLIKKENGFEYMSFRYVSDTSRFIDVLNSILGDVREYILNDHLITVLKQEDISFLDSVVVLDNNKDVVGFLLIRGTESIKEIELIAVKDGSEKQGLGTAMIQLLLQNKKISKIICNTNKQAYHKSLQNIPSLKRLLKKNGFTEENNEVYAITL